VSGPLTWEGAVLWLREQPEQRELVRACFYDDPLEAAAARYHASNEWRAMRPLLPALPGRALDLGAGRDIASYALARDGFEVSALEPDGSPVVGAAAIRALARASGLAIDVRQEWGERLPFEPASFDLVFGRAVLHHARDLPALGREVARVLRPGATFVAAREHVLSAPGDLPAFLEAHPLHRLYGGENAHLQKEYLEAIRGAGLEVVRVLNPLASEVNLFPETREGFREALRRRLGLPWRGLLPLAALPLLGALVRTPGRLYTFVARRPRA
jgi:SAM-dependent methyltransferase